MLHTRSPNLVWKVLYELNAKLRDVSQFYLKSQVKFRISLRITCIIENWIAPVLKLVKATIVTHSGYKQLGI